MNKLNKSEHMAVGVADAAALLGVSRGSLYPLVMSGEIPSIRVGKRRLVPLASLEEWLRAETKKAAVPGTKENDQLQDAIREGAAVGCAHCMSVLLPIIEPERERDDRT